MAQPADAQGFDNQRWLASFQARLRKNWDVPREILKHKQGQVVVTFTVHKDGKITDVLVKQRSAVAVFDESARQAILKSNPAFPLPPEYPRESAPFIVSFCFDQFQSR